MKEINSREATVVAISGDPPEQAEKVTRELGLDFIVLSDEKGDVLRTYGVEDPANGTAWPAMFIIGPESKIMKRVILETYKERPVQEQILAALARPQ